MIKSYISISGHNNELTAEVRAGAHETSPSVDIAPGNQNRKGGSSLFIDDWEQFKKEVDAEFVRVMAEEAQ